MNNTTITTTTGNGIAVRNSAMPVTPFEQAFITPKQALIANAKASEYEMTAQRAKLAIIADALDADDPQAQKQVEGFVKTLRTIATKEAQAAAEGYECTLTVEECNSKASLRSFSMRRVVQMVESNPRASDAAKELTQAVVVATTAMDVIAYAKSGMGLHVDTTDPKYPSMVADLQRELLVKYGTLSSMEVLEAMREYNTRTCTNRTLGAYAPFSISVVKAALESYTEKRNKLLTAIKEEEKRRHVVEEQERTSKLEETYASVVEIYQRQLATAGMNFGFGAGHYIMDEFALRMIREGIVQVSTEEKETIVNMARELAAADGYAYELLAKEAKEQVRTNESSLLNADVLPSGVSVPTLLLWGSTPYYKAKVAEFQHKGMDMRNAKYNALAQVYIVKYTLYFTIRRAAQARQAAYEAARAAAIQNLQK